MRILTTRYEMLCNVDYAAEALSFRILLEPEIVVRSVDRYAPNVGVVKLVEPDGEPQSDVMWKGREIFRKKWLHFGLMVVS